MSKRRVGSKPCLSQIFSLWRVLLLSLLVWSILGLFFTLPALGGSNEPGHSSDLRLALRALAETGGVRLLMDSTVKGLVTTELREDLTAKARMELLAETYGYFYQWSVDGKTLIIGNDNPLEQMGEEKTVEYHLQHIEPLTLLPRLKSILPQNKLRLTEGTKTITITGNTLEHANAADIITYYDRALSCVLLEVRLEEISAEIMGEMGWIIEQDLTSGEGLTPGAPLRFNVVEQDLVAEWEEKNRAAVVANYVLSAEHGKAATLFVGDQYPVVLTRITENGVEELIDYKKVGIGLSVFPTTQEQDLITLNLDVEVNSISDWRKTVRGGDIPVITEIKGSAAQRLQPGEAFVLAGFSLIKDGDEERAPSGLLELPVMGKLLRNRGRVLVENNFGEKRLPCLVLMPRIAQGKEEFDQAYRQLDGGVPSPTAAEITTEVYSVTGETTHFPKELPEVETSVGQVGKSAEPVQEEKTQTGEDAETPVIEVVITEGKVPPPAQQSSELKQTEPGKAVIGLNIPYSVKRGDTVYGVARKYGLNPKDILHLNKLSGTSVLSLGQVLILPIPADHLYQLKAEETIWRIAKRYGLDLQLLMEINSLSDATTLKAGQVIILPVSVDGIVDPEY